MASDGGVFDLTMSHPRTLPCPIESPFGAVKIENKRRKKIPYPTLGIALAIYAA
jgi:hypothetical protein